MKFRTAPKTASYASWFATIALSATLVACGGGSGDTPIDGEVDPNEVPLIGGGDDPDPIIEPDPITEPGASADGCEGLTGTDPDSSTADWGDNCRLQVGGEHQKSRYTQGVQRIVWCRGHDNDQANILDFADGDFGNNTKEQVRLFQEAQGIDADGVVGPETWGELQDVLELLDNQAVDRNTNGVSGGSCVGVAQFYQTREASGALTGWTMAATPGNPETVPFSIDPVQ